MRSFRIEGDYDKSLRWLDLVRVDTLDRPASEAYHNLGTNGTAGYWWRSVPA